jgi:hypothetical protein
LSLIYCTYLTIYKGNLLPPFYIGISSINRIGQGYRGSVKSQVYMSLWKNELKTNPHLFKTIILTTHLNRDEAEKKEEFFHRKLKVVSNPLYVNQHIGNSFPLTKGWKLSDKTREKNETT